MRPKRKESDVREACANRKKAPGKRGRGGGVEKKGVDGGRQERQETGGKGAQERREDSEDRRQAVELAGHLHWALF